MWKSDNYDQREKQRKDAERMKRMPTPESEGESDDSMEARNTRRQQRRH